MVILALYEYAKEFKEMYILGIGLPLSFLFGSIATIIRALLDRREINKQLKEYMQSRPSDQEIRDRIYKLAATNNKDERGNEK